MAASEGLQRIRRCFADAEVRPGDRLVLGVSGGVDSMVLLHLLARSEFAEGLHAVHCNYGFRGSASDGDEALVRETCERLSVPLTVVRDGGDPNASLQLEARRIRYEAFEQAAGPKGRVVLAHHADDQAESFLLASMRAADVGAMGGMRAVSHEGRRLRPLIGAWKAEVLRWAHHMGVTFREDATNALPKYLRNALRLEVMPALEALRPGTAAHWVKLAERVRDWETMVEKSLQGHPGWPVTDPALFGRAELPLEGWWGDVRDREVLRRWCARWGAPASAVDELLTIARPQAPVGARWTNGETKVLRERNALVWSRMNEVHASELRGRLIRSEALSPRPETLRTSEEETCWFAMDALAEPLSARVWQAGDRMTPFGWAPGQTAKVSDLLTQAKVRAEDRPHWPVVVDAVGQILWLPAIRRSHHAPIRSAGERAVRLEWVWSAENTNA